MEELENRLCYEIGEIPKISLNSLLPIKVSLSSGIVKEDYFLTKNGEIYPLSFTIKEDAWNKEKDEEIRNKLREAWELRPIDNINIDEEKCNPFRI